MGSPRVRRAHFASVPGTRNPYMLGMAIYPPQQQHEPAQPGRLRRGFDQGPEGPGRGAQAARHVHRRHRRRIGPAPHGVRGQRQRDRRGAGGCIATGSTSILNADGSVSVTDNGRGIPDRTSTSEEGVSAAEVIMTQLHAGGKFENTSDDNAYKVSGGLHGVGVSVVNALSEWLDLTIWRDGAGTLHALRLRRCGRPAEGRRRGAPGQKGTRVTFFPSPRDVQDHRFRLRQAGASLSRTGVPEFGRHDLFLTDARHEDAPRTVELYYEGGIAAFVKYLDKAKSALMPEPDRDQRHARRTSTIDMSRWSGTIPITRTSCAFTNNIPQRDGGTHLAAFRAALTRTLNQLCGKLGRAQEGEGERSPATTCARG